MEALVIPFEKLRMNDVEQVGGKNASLGEMISQLAHSGVRVPGGFATTAQAYRDFLRTSGLDRRINAALDALDVDDVEALAATGARSAVDCRPRRSRWTAGEGNHGALPAPGGQLEADMSFAVRSSATAEDLPDASFAGQQETFLNIHGLDNVLHAVKDVFASLYNDRAIAYRVHKNFRHADVALSAGVQRMVRSDIGAAGVMFTLDTESGFRDVVFVTASYGLGETVVQGAVNPDEFYVHKPKLAEGKPAIIRRNLGSKLIKMDLHRRQAGRSLGTVGRHRGSTATASPSIRRGSAGTGPLRRDHRKALRPADGHRVGQGRRRRQAVHPAGASGNREVAAESQQCRKAFKLKQHSKVIVSGRAIGQKIATGPVRIVPTLREMVQGAAGRRPRHRHDRPELGAGHEARRAIVTNRGGRTCHAAIIARELGIPAVVGCGNATIPDRGRVGHRLLRRRRYRLHLSRHPRLRGDDPGTRQPAQAAGEDHDERRQPGTGLRVPACPTPASAWRASSSSSTTSSASTRRRSSTGSRAGQPARRDQAPLARLRQPKDFFVEKLAEGVSTIAAAFWPKPVIVRLSDFKSNEYRKLLGGEIYEPEEENPMLGFRGASRYVAPSFRDCFELECRAMKKVRDDMGLTNVEIMVPFTRTVAKPRGVVDLLASNGLKRGENGLKLIMMCEIPSNALLAEQFLQHLRRLLDRFQRPDPADPRPRPRLRPGRQPVRRA
jgi:pyruvate,water dikinase